MDNILNSIHQLYDILKFRPSLKDKLTFNDYQINIFFAIHYKINIELMIGRGFVVYINDSFYCDVEEQDIESFVIDISENDYYIIENKKYKRNRFIFEAEQKFIKNKEKWLNLKNTKIFNKEKILLDS